MILELAAISILNCSIAVYFSQWDAVLWRSAAPNALLIIKLGPRNVKQVQFEMGLIFFCGQPNRSCLFKQINLT